MSKRVRTVGRSWVLYLKRGQPDPPKLNTSAMFDLNFLRGIRVLFCGMEAIWYACLSDSSSRVASASP